MTANQWSPVTVGRMASAVGVAEAALDAAKEHTAGQQRRAQRSLIMQLVLLVARHRPCRRRDDRWSAAASSTRCTTFATPC